MDIANLEGVYPQVFYLNLNSSIFRFVFLPEESFFAFTQMHKTETNVSSLNQYLDTDNGVLS